MVAQRRGDVQLITYLIKRVLYHRFQVQSESRSIQVRALVHLRFTLSVPGSDHYGTKPDLNPTTRKPLGSIP